ncbi:helix-turn-helix domain-containing protein [Halobacterium wangiae]|uniref:helix-turn-helix domain-containing protein n=1 Tax=Halobacterium wangiae TaxID=2902623 RepID=UPI0022B7AFA7|nr:helix-turn-helix domain-containing protein [Halobacterium wangiae]
MSLIAEFTFQHAGLPLMSALESTGVQLDVEQAVAADPDRPVLFVWAFGGDLDAFETAATNEDDTVETITLVEDAGDRRLYRVQVSGSTEMPLYPLDDRLQASRLGVTSSADGIEARLRFPDRASLSEYQPLVEQKGVNVTLRRVYGESDAVFGGEYGLSAKQREALEAAVAAGYFEVPRRASLSDLAEDLGVSTQAVSERLRRGITTLVENALD